MVSISRFGFPGLAGDAAVTQPTGRVTRGRRAPQPPPAQAPPPGAPGTRKPSDHMAPPTERGKTTTTPPEQRKQVFGNAEGGEGRRCSTRVRWCVCVRDCICGSHRPAAPTGPSRGGGGACSIDTAGRVGRRLRGHGTASSCVSPAREGLLGNGSCLRPGTRRWSRPRALGCRDVWGRLRAPRPGRGSSQLWRLGDKVLPKTNKPHGTFPAHTFTVNKPRCAATSSRAAPFPSILQ